MKVLLVEPYYARSEPPLGLMKLSTWHKQQGREVKFIRGTDPFDTLKGWKPDAIDITTPIFSWETDETNEESEFLNTVRLIHEYITDNEHQIMCYVLFNYTDTPEDALSRCQKVVKAGASPYVMPFTPNFYIEGNIHKGKPFINKFWTEKKIRKFYRFWNRYWIWRSVLKQHGEIRPEDIWN